MSHQLLFAVLQGNAFFSLRILQPFLKGGIEVGMEHPAENIAALCAVRIKQLQKFPLRNHGNLLELLCIHAQNRFNLVFHRRKSGRKCCPLRARFLIQRRIRTLRRHALAAQLGSLIRRVAYHAVLSALMGKRQRHKAFGLRLRKIAPHTVHATVRAARLTEQRKADGIKERSFPCACVAADEKKPLLS